MKANCRAVAGLVETYLDGELDPSQLLEVEAHTRTCTRCAERVMLDRAIRGSVRRKASSVRASAALRQRMATAMITERSQRPQPLAMQPSPLSSARSFGGWMLVAMAAAASAPLWFKARNRAVPADDDHPTSTTTQASAQGVGVDNMIDQLVEWHARPLPPEVTDTHDLSTFEPYVGVPVRAPRLAPFGAQWLGGRILPVVDRSVTAMLQYTIQNGHRVTVYVYDPRRLRIQPSSLRPRVVGSEPVYVGHVRGYTFAAAEQRGIGYAVASDLTDEDSAELALAAGP